MALSVGSPDAAFAAGAAGGSPACSDETGEAAGAGATAGRSATAPSTGGRSVASVWLSCASPGGASACVAVGPAAPVAGESGSGGGATTSRVIVYAASSNERSFSESRLRSMRFRRARTSSTLSDVSVERLA